MERNGMIGRRRVLRARISIIRRGQPRAHRKMEKSPWLSGCCLTSCVMITAQVCCTECRCCDRRYTVGADSSTTFAARARLTATGPSEWRHWGLSVGKSAQRTTSVSSLLNDTSKLVSNTGMIGASCCLGALHNREETLLVFIRVAYIDSKECSDEERIDNLPRHQHRATFLVEPVTKGLVNEDGIN